MEQDKGVSVEEAANILGISKDAVRKRIARGTLEATKTDGGWTVVLDGGRSGGQKADAHFWELIQLLQQENEQLRAALERRDAMIERLIERIPPALPEQTNPPRRSLWARVRGVFRGNVTNV